MGTIEQEVTSSTEIDAPVEKVWEALTTPSLIKKWFLGVDTETDWNVGSSIVHRGEYQGKPYVDTGEILTFEPPTLLEHSHWSEGSGKPDSPEQYQVVSWALTERSGGTDLKIDVRGQRLVVDANYSPDVAKATRDEEEQVVESLRFAAP